MKLIVQDWKRHKLECNELKEVREKAKKSTKQMQNQLPIPFVPRHAEVVYHNEHPRILTSEDARLFFKLMIPLQYFVCKEDKVLPNVITQSHYHNDTSHTQKIKVVQTLYTKPIYFSKFIQENPNNFSQEELDIIKGWRDHFVWANFILERFT
jgi:hypothetical protein